MKTADADILVVPGWSDSGPEHWQSRWQRHLPTARRVEQDDWYRPDKDVWVGRLIVAAAVASRPIVVVAHSLGVMVAVHAANKLPPTTFAGLFLVAPADVDRSALWPVTEGHIWPPGSYGFEPVPLGNLPCRSMIVGSADDPYCSVDRARLLAESWGADFADAGLAGHINVASGHGPWPDGLLRFGQFLRGLST